MDRDDQKSPKPVPRFGSFRPHAHAPTPKKISRSDRESSPASEQQRGVSKRHHHRSKRTSHSSKPRPDQDAPAKLETRLVPWDESPSLFDVDVKGDIRNVEYKSSYGSPAYTQPWHDKVLGLKNFWGSGGHRANVPDRGKTSLSKQIRSDLKTSNILRVSPGACDGHQDDEGADYVPLQLRKGRKRKLVDNAINRSSSQGLKSPHHEFPGDGSDSASTPEASLDDASDQSTLEEEGARTHEISKDLQRKKAALSRHVDEARSDWHAWIALVELQDEIDGYPGAFSERPHTKAELHSNADITLSMYNKALKSVLGPEGRERLHLGMMSKAEIVWEPRKLSIHWENITKQHPLSLRVWKRYLDFHQSTSSGFTVEENKKRYTDCLHVLQNARNDMKSSDAKQSAVYGIQIHILLRLTLLLREAGYTEVAVASWQALLEFEFNKPPQFQRSEQTAKSTYDDSVVAFEYFWDSEAPRIGELNAKGWLNFDENDHEQSQPMAEEEASHSGTNYFKSWADDEYRACCSSYLPSHVIDEPLDDPYRTVLFSDIRHALIESPLGAEIHATMAAFLCFCHLPPWSDVAGGQVQTWYEDQFIRNEISYDPGLITRSHDSVANNHDSNKESPVTMVKTGQSSIPSVFTCPTSNYESSPDTLFTPPGQWFSGFYSRTRTISNDFILRTLNTLVNRGVSGDGLAEYLLAFEEHVSPTSVRRSAKNLLKNRSFSLRLYNAYALIETRHGNNEAAAKVWDTALKLSANFDELARRDAVLLWQSRVWQHLSAGETSIALQQLSRYGSESTLEKTWVTDRHLSDETNTTLRLRLRNVLSASRDHMLSLGLSIHAVLYSELQFLSDYLLDTSTIQAALISFTSNLHLLSKITDANDKGRAEALYRQSFARLLYIHTTQKRPISPATIRSFLTESIAAFPHNTVFLSLYAWNESRFRIDDRVRGIMRDIVFSNTHRDDNNNNNNNNRNHNHITTHFFAIHTDIQRGTIQGSNLSAVRGTFERALSDPSAAHSAGLWKWYFLYEIENGDMKRARDVYYRAIKACTWAKGIYMLAFEYLSEVMEAGELRGIYEMMGEKELRIHVAL
ncbi:MAG: hypothetical protein Q9168_000005 [Polycauliona sp. 1 TL-2023]